ncbi:protein CURLY FLAG LEAF 1 [Mercurialis annua]|uniref:protein CURLY FLAG LEAF 1 n=1 Tax=Mercurialis annua TaxID=3986 RepID=UPI002160CEDA|nr:protein CURLY FLAG LEAF 1 [Mercurialis annua]
MTGPNMAAITASLERSLQNCSLDHHLPHQTMGVFGERSSSSDHHHHHHHVHDHSNNNNLQISNSSSSDTTLELNSHVSLPCHWEQCLDLKTGEIYYINWRNGMKAKEDPREITQEYNGDYYYTEEEDNEDDSSCDSEESSSESSPSPCSTFNNNNNNNNRVQQQKEDHVLVVGGCKSCLMYFMVPKQVQDCPKCNGHLLHFDRSDSNPSP